MQKLIRLSGDEAFLVPDLDQQVSLRCQRPRPGVGITVVLAVQHIELAAARLGTGDEEEVRFHDKNPTIVPISNWRQRGRVPGRSLKSGCQGCRRFPAPGLLASPQLKRGTQPT